MFAGCASVDPVMPPRRRVVAFGDVHGDLGLLTVLLRDLARVVSFAPEPEWVGGDTVVVCMGDVVDRYRPGLTQVDAEGRGVGEVEDEEERILRLLNTLAAAARLAGGALVRLVGNHELMNLDGQVAYATPYAVRRHGGEDGRRRWFRDTGAPLVACGAVPVMRIGHWTFAHGGMMQPTDLRAAARRMHRVLAGEDGASFRGCEPESCSVLWERRQGTDPDADVCRATQAALEGSTQALPGRQRLVVAHTTQVHGRGRAYRTVDPDETDDDRVTLVGPGVLTDAPGINYTCPTSNRDGQVWRIDVAMSRAFHDGGPPVRARRPALLDIRYVGGDEYDVRVVVSRRDL